MRWSAEVLASILECNALPMSLAAGVKQVVASCTQVTNEARVKRLVVGVENLVGVWALCGDAWYTLCLIVTRTELEVARFATMRTVQPTRRMTLWYFKSAIATDVR